MHPSLGSGSQEEGRVNVWWLGSLARSPIAGLLMREGTSVSDKGTINWSLTEERGQIPGRVNQSKRVVKECALLSAGTYHLYDFRETV